MSPFQHIFPEFKILKADRNEKLAKHMYLMLEEGSSDSAIARVSHKDQVIVILTPHGKPLYPCRFKWLLVGIIKF